MSTLHLRLMHREALQRLADAEVLHRASAIDAPSASIHLLQLLGLELLLKLVHEVVLQEKSTHSHAYEKIFQALPVHLQNRLLKLAEERIGPSILSRDAIPVLKEWGRNFIDLRYPYERYESLTEEQYAALGKQWVAKGAPMEEASFRYHPEELFGMLHALRLVAEEMATQSYQPTASGGG